MKKSRSSVSVCLLLFLSLVVQSNLFAQQQEIDRLSRQLPAALRLDSFKLFTQLASVYQADPNDVKKIIYYARQAHLLSWKIGDSLDIVQSGKVLGELYERSNALDSQRQVLERILPIAKRNNFIDEQANISTHLGLAFIYRAKYDLALENLFDALTFWELLKDTAQISNAITGIGIVYYKIKDDEKALQYYSRALALKNKTSDKKEIELLLLDISLCFSSQGKFEDSRKYLNQVKQVCAQKKCSPSIQLELDVTTGVYFFRRDSLSQAEEKFLSGNQLAIDENNTRLSLECAINLSRIYLKQNKIELATQYLEQAERSGNTSGFDNELMQLYTQFADLYKKVNNYKMLVRYQDKYLQLRDSVSGEDVRNNLMHVQAEYLERENEAKIKSRTEMLALQDEIIERQKTVRILIALVVVLFILISFFLYKSNQNRKLANTLLSKKVEERTKELETSFRELKIAMEQRDVALRKVTSEIRSSMVTVTGLCSLGMKDVSQKESIDYLESIRKASQTLMTISSELASENISKE
jgi:tetratricopeptide (TPR) repeat protein